LNPSQWPAESGSAFVMARAALPQNMIEAMISSQAEFEILKLNMDAFLSAETVL